MSVTAPTDWSQKGQQHVWKRETADGLEKVWIGSNSYEYCVKATKGGELVEREYFDLIHKAEDYVEEYISNN